MNRHIKLWLLRCTCTIALTSPAVGCRSSLPQHAPTHALAPANVNPPMADKARNNPAAPAGVGVQSFQAPDDHPLVLQANAIRQAADPSGATPDNTNASSPPATATPTAAATPTATAAGTTASLPPNNSAGTQRR